MLFEMYTDGSYNEKTKIYGGAYAIAGVIEGAVADDDAALVPARNVAGECLAVIRGIAALSRKVALSPGDEILVFHDYTGLAEWADGRWRAKQPVSQRYVASIQKLREEFGLLIHFKKVPAHAGVPENEHVDKLAKKAVGLL